MPKWISASNNGRKARGTEQTCEDRALESQEHQEKCRHDTDSSLQSEHKPRPVPCPILFVEQVRYSWRHTIPDYLSKKISSGEHICRIVFNPLMTLQPSDGDHPFEWQRHELPVSVAFAITINKSQGQTYKCVGVWLAGVCSVQRVGVCRVWWCWCV